VTLDGQQLRLTPEEFVVLVFLSSHPQSMVAPRTMLATNWTDQSPSPDRVLNDFNFPP
jgi:DNA-binding response OmpR family regulator